MAEKDRIDAVKRVDTCCEREKKPDCPYPRTMHKKQWKKPVLEDVSGKIMAQPYIRFT